MIDEEKAEEAVRWLAKTDVRFGQLKGEVLKAEQLCKRVRARNFLIAEGSSVKEREAAAEITPEVAEADQALVEVTIEYEVMRAERNTRDIGIQMWRSQESSRRQGMV